MPKFTFISSQVLAGGVLPVLLREFDNLGAARAGFDAHREAGTETAPDAPVLTAISGNSGGAISALLGCYGFVTGGAAQAQQGLDDFWHKNAAIGWSEWGLNRFWRALGDSAGLAGWDIKSSPYEFPLACATWFNRTAWPLIASGLGPANPWMRPDYFSLPRLLAPCVDWPLVAALGEFAGIPLEIERWVRSHLEAALFAPDTPCRQRYAADRRAIEERIGARLGALERLRARMDALGIGEGTLLHAAVQRWRAPPPAFHEGQGIDADSLAPPAALAAAVQSVTRHIPHLLLGAVELHEGDFMAFSSERAPDDGGITLGAVLASAAVPWLFQAQAVAGTDQDTLAPRGLMLWDGQLSQNPPIRNFLAGLLDDARKPDEIWVVQLNPYQARTEPGPLPRSARQLVMSGGEIWDLRNALSGNLSLNQEIGFVDAVNRRIEKEQREKRELRRELRDALRRERERRGLDGAGWTGRPPAALAGTVRTAARATAATTAPQTCAGAAATSRCGSTASSWIPTAWRRRPGCSWARPPSSTAIRICNACWATTGAARRGATWPCGASSSRCAARWTARWRMPAPAPLQARVRARTTRLPAPPAGRWAGAGGW
ncbi:hypothetical protein HH212_21840 [Massilia forsythiae]|uniref:PNPLA domain-containing protein n=1 Tax=Massilia forsythiae TaxID=2728020 RepID=A0A7Z2ZVP0_9BURK|nr:hypothetical protein [Massilia forsythiae]QJE02337.1 hypothetical protein HH212_21840 [Massilia forsythiae]